MKFEHNRKYMTIAIYALAVLLIAIACNHAMGSMDGLFGFFGRIVQILVPIVYGVVFAFLLNPMLRYYDDRLLRRLSRNRLKPSTRRAFGLILTYLTALVGISIFIAIVIPQLLSSLWSLFSRVPEYIKSLSIMYNDFNAWLGSFLTPEAGNAANVGDELSQRIMGMLSGIMGSLYEMLEHSISALDSLKNSFNALVSFTTSFTSGIINLVIGLIVSIYILTDREKLFAQLKKAARAVFSQNVYELLYDISLDITRIFSGFVVGKVIDSLIIGILCAVGMTILRMPYTVLVSVIVGLTNVIPYFGPFIGAIPGFIIIFIDNPIKSLWFLVFIFLLQQLDGNVIGPKILGDSIGLSPLWIITSITLFSGLMGILGMFIGVPLFAIIYSLAKRFIAFLLRRKGESSNTRDYASEKNPLIK